MNTKVYSGKNTALIGIRNPQKVLTGRSAFLCGFLCLWGSYILQIWL